MRRVAWGILGCGSIATHAIAPAIGWSVNGTLVAVASRSGSTAREKAEAVGAARAHGSYDALLEDPDVAAVYVGTPNGVHEAWCVRAARAGKHVLCDKSLALSSASARRMAEVAAEHRMRLVEGFMYRHHPQWAAIRRWLDDGAIGRIRMVRASFSGCAPEGDHRWSASLGGGALYDVVCYGVDAARFLLRAEPVAVTATSDLATDEAVDATTTAVLEFPDGVMAIASGSLRTVPDQSLTVLGTAGRIEVARPFVPGWAPTVITLERPDGTRSIEVGGANQFLHQMEHFARLVLDASAPAAPAEDGVANALALEAIALAARSGQRVAVDAGTGRPRTEHPGSF